MLLSLFWGLYIPVLVIIIVCAGTTFAVNADFLNHGDRSASNRLIWSHRALWASPAWPLWIPIAFVLLVKKGFVEYRRTLKRALKVGKK